MRGTRHGWTAVLAAGCLGSGALAQAPAGQVASDILIAQGRGGFQGPLKAGDAFGSSGAAIGDVDGDGIGDLAVGANFDSEGVTGCCSKPGALWILFLETDSSVKGSQKINNVQGGFTGTLLESNLFGSSIAVLGDLDGNGTADLAVGAPGTTAGGKSSAGAIWVLMLQPDGTVKSTFKISQGFGGFSGPLHDGDSFGNSMAAIGDCDGDGIGDLAVGAWGDDDGDLNTGAVWLLFLQPDGTVKSQHKVSALEGGFSGPLHAIDWFGGAVASVGDLDGDGTPDLAVGAPLDDDGASEAGAVWILFLTPDGTVKSHQKISAASGGFAGPLDWGDYFGISLASVADLDGDGRRDVAVGARFDDDGVDHLYGDFGAVWILFPNADGTLHGQQKISKTQGGLGAALPQGASFGTSIGAVGDLDGDGADDLIVGQTGPTYVKGNAWLLFLMRAQWTWLGQGLAGSSGVPELFCQGTLLPNQPVSLSLAHSLPGAPLTLVLGLSEAGLAFKGGVLVPQPDVLIPGNSSAQGTWSLLAKWPSGVPVGLHAYLQAWQADPGAAQGFAASNALVAVTP